MSKESIEYHAFHQGLSQNKEPINSCRVYRVSAKPNANPVHAKPKGCLTEVDLTGCWEMDDNVLKNFLSNFPRLSKVTLGNIYSLTDLTMRALATHTMDLTMIRGLGMLPSIIGIRSGPYMITKVKTMAVQEFVKPVRE